MHRYTYTWKRRGSAGLVALLLLAAGCGSADRQEGIAESEAGQITSASTAGAAGIEPTTETDLTDTEETEATGDTAQNGAADGDDTQGAASTGSISDELILDLNYDVPDTLTSGLVHGEIRNLLVDVHGPTDDVAAEINRLSTFPASFPTMPGSDIYEFSLSSNVDSSRPNYDAHVRFSLEAPAADIIAFYEANLTAPSFVLTETSDRTEEELTIHTAIYSTPTSDGALDGLTISFVTGEFAGTIVIVDYADTLSPGERARAIDQMSVLVAWYPDPAPIPPDWEPYVVSLVSQHSTGLGTTSNATWVAHELKYPNAAGEEVAQAAYDLVGESDYSFADSNKLPPEEIIPTALAEDQTSIFFALAHPDLTSSFRVTVSFYGENDPSTLFQANTDLFKAP